MNDEIRDPKKGVSSNTPWHKSLQNWKIILEIIAIPFAVFYAIVTWCQWRDLKHNFEVDQRAWLRLSVRAPINLEASPALVLTAIKNTGKSPAQFLADAVFEVVDEQKSPSFGTLHKAHSSAFVRQPLFPSDESPFQIIFWDSDTTNPRGFSRQEVERLKAGKAYIAVYGIILYNDQFGQHWNRFCIATAYPPVPGGQPLPMLQCENWNAYGDGVLDQIPYK